MRIHYLTGCTGAYLEDGTAEAAGIGLLIQPGNGYARRVERYQLWGADNGAFSRRGGFNERKFLKMLDSPFAQRAVGTCRFVAAPDCLVVGQGGEVTGDARGTLDKFEVWQPKIRERGYPVALVAQDGLEGMLDVVPWDRVDVLFLGGSTGWKVGEGARTCAEAAGVRGVPVHMGRVNSLRRLRLALSFGCSTADGTFLGFGPTKNLPRLLGWLKALEVV